MTSYRRVAFWSLTKLTDSLTVGPTSPVHLTLGPPRKREIIMAVRNKISIPIKRWFGWLRSGYAINFFFFFLVVGCVFFYCLVAIIIIKVYN